MQCQNCRENIPADAKFCPYCASSTAVVSTGPTTRLKNPSYDFEKTFQARRVIIGELLGNVRVIEVKGIDFVHVSVIGDPEQVGWRLKVEELTGPSIRITSMLPYLYGDEIRKAENVLRMTGRGIDLDKTLDITIEVPPYTQLYLQDTIGTITINCPTCTLSSTITSTLKVLVENIGEIDIDVTEGAKATVESVEKSARLVASGKDSIITVNDCYISRLVVKTDNLGKVIFNGSAIEATVNSQTSGEVSLSVVVQSLEVYAAASTVTIEGGDCKWLDVTAQNGAYVTHNGSAFQSSLTASGNARVYLERSIYQYNKSEMNGGKVTVNNVR